MQVWHIKGFDGTELVYETKVALHLFSDRQIEELLRRLVSRNLSEEEVVEASLNRKDRRTAVLEVSRSAQLPRIISCGENPHYSARVVER